MWVFAAAAVVWFGSLLAAPYAASHLEAGSPWRVPGLVTYVIGSFICHQRPERSFHLAATPLPVCARCMGIYVGAAIVAFAAMAVRPTRDARCDLQKPRLVLLVAAVPAIATLVYEWLSGEAPANWIRASAGAPIGAAVTVVIIAALTPLSSPSQKKTMR